MGIRQFVRTRSLQTRLLLSFATLFAVVLGGGLLTWYSSATIRSQQDATLSADLAERVVQRNLDRDTQQALVESVIKRRANFKASGHAIPGIGGMFDLSEKQARTGANQKHAQPRGQVEDACEGLGVRVGVAAAGDESNGAE